MAEEDPWQTVKEMARTLDDSDMTSTLSSALERIHSECMKNESVDKATSSMFSGVAALGHLRDPALKDAYRAVFDASFKFTGLRKAVGHVGEKLS